jgi:25S rRNA (uracil2843-N3)-methyltransferase
MLQSKEMNKTKKSLSTKKTTSSKSKADSKGQRRPETRSQPFAAKDQDVTPNELPLELQQLLLNIFANCLHDPNTRDLLEVLQEVKGHLYNRDFAAAFGQDEYLRAYALRWSTSRALGYLRLLDGVFKDYFDDGSDDNIGSETIKIAFVGGGAGAELVALAGVVKLRSKQATDADLEHELKEPSIEERSTSLRPLVDAVFVDIADWNAIIQALHRGATTAPPISAYASAAAKAANVPLLPSTSIHSSFQRHDVLSLSGDELKNVGAGKQLITIFFTLNELYTASLPKTRKFLLELTQRVDEGTLLLVIDSAGSYSTVTLNGHEKKYPMHWLLDHTLLQPPAAEKSSADDEDARKAKREWQPSWEKLQEKESEWFRIPEGLRYPLELENMRYQLHLYRRL